LSMETVFSLELPDIVFGPGCSSETGVRLAQLSVSRALLVCDPHVVSSGTAARLQKEMRAAGVASEVFDGIAGEPTEASVAEASAAATSDGFDGFVGVGGGSALDTAKLCALFAAHGGGIYDYLNKPIGEGRQVPGPVLPLLALPTTSGTGSEVTTVAIVDVGVKSGISHRFLRPRIAIVDPLLTTSCPPGVTASVGLDALLHAVEAFTTLPYDERVARSPAERPPYQGAHPMSDLLCEKAITMIGANLRRAVEDGSAVDGRGQMALAATIAGVGFGSAGVHIPHALSYPIASLKHAWTPPGYGGAAFVPHGLAVAVTAPASLRFIADAAPDRCRTAARLLDGGDDLAESIERLMRDVGSPMTISELGYGEEDIPEIVEGALVQQRLLVNSPKPIDAAALEIILRESL
jgi:hydroxyacid-oxoacid transhydrogenase